MTRIKTILVDDEILNLKNLEIILIENFPEIQILGLFQTTEDAKLFIENNPIQLLFLDISMPIENGFDLLAHFPVRNFQVIFVTAHEDFAINAIRVGAIDYILKPILISELRIAITKVSEICKPEIVNKLTLTYEGGKSILDFDEILYLKGFDNITTIYLTKKRKITVAKTLKHFESILKNDFFRIHKSFIVNLNFVSKTLSKEAYFLELNEGTQLPVSRRNYKSLNTFLKK
ncbi:LytTR family DNA-binding domain-containing protein [Flavobacterium sp. XS2P24]|uniref:LytR/AlgR family response regulator transcription factor n=1 Tax=Flavobacterium sp. XS2P24 TaxID=3041249 RepID=UPI0024A95012|nr:LytTR family DNA-binding domain-containing protein [Flavobacterium sp. XS2P24]MDI6049330.1 LytTR family DNA-binding domain-containing protein [Flavobacterium sp. XS2P24]